MRRSLVLVFVVALGVTALAEDKVVHDKGSAMARFAWEAWKGRDFAGEKPTIVRTVEGAGTGTVELDSGATAVWISYDPERTTADTILRRLKESRLYEAATLTTVVSTFKGDWGVLHGAAVVHQGKTPKLKGEVTITIDAAEGHSPDASPGKARGKWQPGFSYKLPAEVELVKGKDRFSKSGSRQMVQLETSCKKTATDKVVWVTVNFVDKVGGKESLHTVELPVVVQGP
ncbi:MAG TPA: hypothetical protein VFF73_00945 [Planctomycetota bacterium]|nr:hypothetical protein [Planctomycetota bacterium]